MFEVLTNYKITHGIFKWVLQFSSQACPQPLCKQYWHNFHYQLWGSKACCWL